MRPTVPKHSELAASLEQFILKQLDQSRRGEYFGPRSLTIGIEHEFFLLGRDGIPATHCQSQEFLKLLAREPGWHIQEKLDSSAFGSILMRVSKDERSGRYTALKYDHHPHLLELAFSFCESMDEMNLNVSQVFDTLTRLSDKLGLRMGHSSSLNLSPNDSRINSVLPEFENLRHYRTLLLNKKKRKSNPAHANYAAVIAATQTHIGGTTWWERPALVESLYKLEPLALGWGIHCLKENDLTKTEILKKRWEGYADVFEGYPLVGFPQLPAWSLQNWTSALLASPLYGGTDDRFAAQTANEIGELPFSEWREFIKSVRDLQIIRPKLFGTLEFRADPAQPDPRSIIGMSALRLGLCASLLADSQVNVSFSEAHDRWWEMVTSGKTDLSMELIEKAVFGLKLRGLGEESYLSDFRQKEVDQIHETKKAG